MQRLLLSVALVACGGGSTAPTAPSNVAQPAADPAPCEDASTNAVKFLDKDMPADKVKGVMMQHCTGDKWSVDTRKCLLTAKSLEELDGCAKQLTPEQQAGFKGDLGKLDPGTSVGSGSVGTPAPPQNTPPSQIPPPAGSMPK
ncbi:hypothetical protein BH11MYX1_BH11MYX1_30430 [soil metagenome]